MTLKMYDLTGADERLRFSPYCWRVRMACAHKGLVLETLPWRFVEKAKLPQPNEGTVPLLLDDAKVVSDSWRIALYLDERYPEHPLFDSAQARSSALLIKYWIERAIHPFITRMMVRDAWAGLHERDKTYFRESREKRLGKTLEQVVAGRDDTRVQFRQAIEPLRATLTDQTFVCGERPGYADYICFGAFMWARCVSNFEPLEAGDPVWAWRDRLLDLYDGMAGSALRNPALI